MNAPFGSQVDDVGRVVPHAGERMAVTYALYYRARGYSLRGIARQLELDGFLNRRGRPHVLTAVARMVRRAERVRVPPTT